MTRKLVDVFYAVAVLGVFIVFPGAAVVAGLVTLPVFSFLDKPISILLVPIVAAMLLGGLMIPITRLSGPETIPLYAVVSGAAAALLAGLHLARLKLLGELSSKSPRP
jgi:hypothetical protein